MKQPKFEKKVLEHHVKAAVKQRLNEIGAYQFWPVQMGRGAATLDCLICFNSTFYCIETKRPGEKPTARQEITMQKIRAAGGRVIVVDSVEAARKLSIT